MEKNIYKIGSKLYVTSDEQPKHNDYYTTDGKEIYYCNTLNPTRNNHYKKVILTTDQDLIGVQAIDDEFLEWFVKNPSCESVEVFKERSHGVEFIDDYPKGFFDYKIIIPQEEPKQDYKPNSCDIIFETAALIENKQETLEEAAANLADPNLCKTDNWIAGAKWQAERMYTYDELRQIAYNAYCKGQLDEPTEGKFNLWIQQFKKK
jgi:hypothetical protein